MYQLVNDKVTVWSPGIKKIVDENYVYSKFGIRPYNFCLARCFIGDKSDNLKGIKGLGFKTLLKRFPDLSSNENIELNDLLNYAGVMNETTKLKIYNSVVDNKHLLRRNWKIMYLDTLNLSGSQVEKINFLFEQTTPKVDKINLMRILVKHGINSFNVDKFVMSIKSSIV